MYAHVCAPRRYQAGPGAEPSAGPEGEGGAPAAPARARRQHAAVEVVGAEDVCRRQGCLEALTAAGLQGARVATVVQPLHDILVSPEAYFISRKVSVVWLPHSFFGLEACSWTRKLSSCSSTCLVHRAHLYVRLLSASAATPVAHIST